MALKEVDVKSLDINPFTAIGDDWMLVTAGDAASHNTMTASWGGLGVLWGAPVATCYIRQSRYTKEFVDGSDLFTLSFLDPAVWRRQLSYLGRVSGRDEDKIKAAGLTPRGRGRHDDLRRGASHAGLPQGVCYLPWSRGVCCPAGHGG